MNVLRGYKTELDPNNKQRTALLQHAGAARWAYNWGLRRKIEVYAETGGSPSAIDLHRELNVLKKIPKDQGGCPWAYESSKCAMQEALRNLDAAFKNFFRRCGTKVAKKGFPKFKSRKCGIGSFTLTGAIRANDRTVRLPRLGKLRLKEYGYLPGPDRKDVKVSAASVSERAGRWFVSLQIERSVPEPAVRPEHVVGVDVGVRSLAVTSDGEVFANPRALKSAEGRLRMLQKSIARKQKGGSNRRKAVRHVARLHYRVSCIRKDAMHKATSAIAKSASVVVLESLNVSGMLRNHRLARALSDASISEIHRQIKYKTAWNGGLVVEADRWFPSSKTCSGCGAAKAELDLNEREYVCDICGLVIDRDLNAAINLKNLAGSSSVSACCPGSSGRLRSTKLLVGQEPNTGVGPYV